jgi:hypothetical protein
VDALSKPRKILTPNKLVTAQTRSGQFVQALVGWFHRKELWGEFAERVLLEGGSNKKPSEFRGAAPLGTPGGRGFGPENNEFLLRYYYLY